MKWAIVEIFEEGRLECAVIPENWINSDESGCFWPTTKNYSALVARAQEPDETFNIYECRIIKWFDTYHDARRKLPIATQRSDLDSDPADQFTRRIRHRRLFSSSDSEFSDDVGSPAKKRPWKSSLPPIKRICLPSVPSKKQMMSPAMSLITSSEKTPTNFSVKDRLKSPLKTLPKHRTKETNSPAKSPMNSPAKSPMNSPAKSPMNSPAKSPMNSPAKSPMNSPAKSLINSSEKTPTNISVKKRVKSPSKTTTNFSVKKRVTSPLKTLPKHHTKESNSPAKSLMNSPEKTLKNFPAEELVNSPLKTLLKHHTKELKSPAKTPAKSPSENLSWLSPSSSKTSTSQPVSPPNSLPLNEEIEGGHENGDISGFRLVKLLLTKIEKINMVLRQQGDQLNEISHRLRSKEKLPSRPQTFAMILPVKTLQEFDALEACLSCKENELYLMRRLAKIKFSTVKCTVSEMMAEVLSRRVASFFNWAGKGKKQSFKSTRVCHIMIEAAKVSFNSAANADLTQPIKDWLKYSPFRG